MDFTWNFFSCKPNFENFYKHRKGKALNGRRKNYINKLRENWKQISFMGSGSENQHTPNFMRIRDLVGQMELQVHRRKLRSKIMLDFEYIL